jgi:hypothetical protein
VKSYIQEVLLHSFAQETDSHVRNKIGDAVAEAARQLSDAGEMILHYHHRLAKSSGSFQAFLLVISAMCLN